MPSTQVNMTDDGTRLYSVNRDVAHNFGFIAEKVAERLEDGQWTFLTEFCKQYEISQDDLGEACRTFCLFLASATEHRGEKMVECMRRVGYYDVKEPAQVAYMATLGAVLTGVFWVGVHEATSGGVGPCMRMQDLVEFGALSAKRMQLPRWKRVLHRWLGRWEAVWAALRGKRYGQQGQAIPQAQVQQQTHKAVRQRFTARGRPGEGVPGAGDSQDQQGDGQVVRERAEPGSGDRAPGGPDQGQA